MKNPMLDQLKRIFHVNICMTEGWLVGFPFNDVRRTLIITDLLKEALGLSQLLAPLAHSIL